jgi:glycosyltransferase involved in cell wall biosynthesis
MSIAIVVPVYKHSILLFDAIASLWLENQSVDGSASTNRNQFHDRRPLLCDIVVVDDGCPDPATMFGGLGLHCLDPRIHYLRGANRGLSGARNRGVEFVLAELPGAEAVFFLDADNMLSPWSIPQMVRVLAEQPEADWFYPDIRMFGLEWEGDYSGAYTALAQSLENICEAGSLVRRRVFDAGLRFSEAMRLGLEDWDFWLSAVETGFRGRHFPQSGFRYRKRPESMLADSNRDVAAIRHDLENRHPWVCDLRTLLALEHVECPRYAIYLCDLHAVRLTSSAEGHTEELSWPDYVTRFWCAARVPNAFHSGAMLIIASSTDVRLLAEAKLWHWALSDLESRLRDSNVASIAIRMADAGQIGIDRPSTDPDPGASFAAVSTYLLREIVLDSTDAWIATIDTAQPAPRVSRRDVFLPPWALSSQPRGGALQTLVGLCRDLRRSEYAASRFLPGSGMERGTPDRSRLHQTLRQRFGGGLIPPALRHDRPEIAFVVPLVEFGGVEKVAIAMAAALKPLGYGVSLVVLGARDLQLAVAVRRTFDRILFMDNAEFHDWSGPNYGGTHLSRWSTLGNHANELNQLLVFDVVIAAHAGDVLGLMGELRRRGVVTASHVHLFDRSPLGRHVGHPVLAVAFEHALDLVIGCSRQIHSEMLALGVPRAKLALVPNASTLQVAPERLQALHQARRARDSAVLNVLFLGRIDQQKGIERLIALHHRFQGDTRVRFRLIGKSVVDDRPLPPTIVAVLEPPVYQASDLLAAYSWADVLVLPSLHEGLPLTLLEAMALGVVPIVARAGAIEEAVRDGVDGWIVSQERCVHEITRRIEQLAGDRTRLRAMSDAAIEAMRGRNWNESVKELDAALRRMLEGRGRTRHRLLPALSSGHAPARTNAVLRPSGALDGVDAADRVNGSSGLAGSAAFRRSGIRPGTEAEAQAPRMTRPRVSPVAGGAPSRPGRS